MVQAQVDRMVEQGATCGDIAGIRGSLSKYSNKRLYEKLNAHYQKRFPLYKTRDGDQSTAYETMKLISYDVAGAVYELDASIDDGDY